MVICATAIMVASDALVAPITHVPIHAFFDELLRISGRVLGLNLIEIAGPFNPAMLLRRNSRTEVSDR
jgi:hypothetical protein